MVMTTMTHVTASAAINYNGIPELAGNVVKLKSSRGDSQEQTTHPPPPPPHTQAVIESVALRADVKQLP